ncbi:hypothetical protein [Nonomuraea sp. SYSU D8015]|uniref:hypothetical protein n=1 Tax=Nonomuraea sp. SYSU D8015 TaxID=2593644 RepID=UPI0016611CB8|nr:hypothetical protein [Nonomuraea sp. SYSU D8015]
MTVRAKVLLRTPGLRQPMPLPTRSLMAWIGTDPQGRPYLLGVELDIPDKIALNPEESDLVAEAEFWYEDAGRYVKPQAEYRLWYGGDVGTIKIVELTEER